MERKSSQILLVELEEKAALLQHITDNMLDLVALTDPQGNFTYLGNSHEILGYDLEYIKGKNIMDFVHPADQQPVSEAFQSFIQNREDGRRMEYRVQCRDGSCLWLETMGKILTDDTGKIKELLFSSRDITEQKQENEKLKQVVKASQLFLDTSEKVDYQYLTEEIRSLTGAAYAACNRFDKEGRGFTTKALVGVSSHIEKAANLLGFEIVGKEWPYDPNREEKTRHKTITTFDSLEMLTGKIIPARLIHLLEKTFHIGQTVIVKITKQDRILGDFTLLMPRGETLAHPDLVALYASQVGLMLDREEYQHLLEQERQELQKKEARLRIIFEHLPIGMIRFGTEGTIIDFNDRFVEQMGSTREKLKGFNTLRYSSREMIGTLQKALAGEPALFENEYTSVTGGKTSFLRVNFNPVNPGQNPTEVIATLEDITERKQMEETIALSERTHREIFNSSVDALFIHDIETGEILDVNDTMLMMFGYDREDLPGLNVSILSDNVDPFIEEKAKSLIRQCADGENIKFEWVCRRKNGEHFHTENYLQRVTIAGQPRIMATVRDITDRKEAEEKIQEFADQLEKKNMELDIALYQEQEASEAKTKFLATMNHEIRTPLNGMLGFLQLLEQTPLSDVQSEYMSYMNYSAQHLLSLVNNVLDMAKIEAGEMQLDKRPFHLAEEIDTALASLYPLAREKGLQLQVLKAANLPDRLEGDPLRLRQILLNLVGNALKFTEEGSVHLTIESLGSTGVFHNLHLEVRDTGPGMDQNSQDKLFQPFFQISDNHTPHPGGTGLGLPITRELVELMGGRIQVFSVLGKGSTFTVRLNLKEIKETPQSQEKNSPSRKTNPVPEIRRLLLVEDQEMNQVLMKHRLTERGLAFDLAQNGKEAVEMAIRHPYDMILMDIQMPLMDGLEATRQIRRNTEIPQPRIVAMTACTTLKEQETFLAAGMDGFLTKPITIENLDRILNEKT